MELTLNAGHGRGPPAGPHRDGPRPWPMLAAAQLVATERRASRLSRAAAAALQAHSDHDS